MPLAQAIVAWLLTSQAPAQTAVDAHGLAIGDLGSALDAPALTPWAATSVRGSGWAGLALDYSDRTWVSAFEGTLLDDLVTVHAAGGYSLHERFRITGSLPAHLSSVDARGAVQPASPGDARLGLHPVLSSGPMLDFGATLGASLPTGAPRRLLGRGGPSVDLLATTTWRPGTLRLTATTGPSFRPPIGRLEGSGPGHAWLLGGALSARFADVVALGTELRVDAPIAASARSVTGSAVELLGTARVALGREVLATFGVGAGPTHAAGSPASRLLFGLGWSPRPPEAEPEEVVDAPPEPEPEPEPEPLEVTPEETLVWIPHPVCQWLPFSDARDRLDALPPGTQVHLAAPGYLPRTADVDGGKVALQPAPPRGGLVMVGGPGDRVWVDGELLPSAEDGVSVLGITEGSHTVEVEGAGRAWADEAATVEGYALWLRAPAGPPVGLLFSVGSSRLNRAAEGSLEQLVAHPGDWVYEIRGSFSPEGEHRDNRRLAAARAATVAGWLRDHGLPADQIRVYAGTEPDPRYGPREQRRVDVIPLERRP